MKGPARRVAPRLVLTPTRFSYELAGVGVDAVRRRLRGRHVVTLLDPRTGRWVISRRQVDALCDVVAGMGGSVRFAADSTSQGELWSA
jgi:hypothetical protein